MPRGKFKFVKACSLAGGVLFLCLLGRALIVAGRPLPRPPLPNPNGYDDFLRAQKEMVGYYGDVTTTSAEQLREHLAKNAEALKLLRRGLAKQCRIPLEFSTNYLFLRSLGGVKKLVWLIRADGRLAELERRTNDAAKIYVEAIRYGQESCRGGVMIDRLVGIACETIGISALEKIRANLDAETCLVTLRQLREAERREEPVADVFRNEREWMRMNVSLWQRLRTMIPVAGLNPVKPAQQTLVKSCQQFQQQLKSLIIAVAAHAYELEHGRRPKNLDELVPEYLDAIPIDPFTGTNLTYTP